MAYCIKLVVLVHHNKMKSLNGKIMICLKKNSYDKVTNTRSKGVLVIRLSIS